MKELELNKQLSGLTESKAQQIKEIFEPMTKMIGEFEGYYNEIIKMEQSHEKCEKAKRLRVDISRVRISAEKARKQQKEEYLLAGRAIDGVSNILKYAISEKEEKLKEVETFYERMEKERVDKIRGERAAEVAKYDPIGAAVGVDFGMMPDDVWDKYVSGWRESFEACKEAERKAEEERIEVRRKAEAEEEERKKMFFKEKQKEIRIASIKTYASSADIGLIKIDMTEEEFQSILDEYKNKHEEEKKRMAEERAEAERKDRIWHERVACLQAYPPFNDIGLIKDDMTEEEFRATLEESKNKHKEHEESRKKIKEENERLKAENEERARIDKMREDAEKVREMAPDKEKLLDNAQILLRAKEKANSKEAINAFSAAISILENAANKMAARV